LPEKDIYSGQETAHLSSIDAKELGRLRREKEKWDKSIEAAVTAALFCFDQGERITRKQLWSVLSEKGFRDIPDTTFDKIWKAIPSKYRNLGGRPKKES